MLIFSGCQFHEKNPRDLIIREKNNETNIKGRYNIIEPTPIKKIESFTDGSYIVQFEEEKEYKQKTSFKDGYRYDYVREAWMYDYGKQYVLVKDYKFLKLSEDKANENLEYFNGYLYDVNQGGNNPKKIDFLELFKDYIPEDNTAINVGLNNHDQTGKELFLYVSMENEKEDKYYRYNLETEEMREAPVPGQRLPRIDNQDVFPDTRYGRLRFMSAYSRERTIERDMFSDDDSILYEKEQWKPMKEQEQEMMLFKNYPKVKKYFQNNNHEVVFYTVNGNQSYDELTVNMYQNEEDMYESIFVSAKNSGDGQEHPITSKKEWERLFQERLAKQKREGLM